MPKTKSKKQVGYLLSSGSPLTPEQKNKLKGELHSGAVKVAGGKKGKPKGKVPPKKFKKKAAPPMMENPISRAMTGM